MSLRGARRSQDAETVLLSATTRFPGHAPAGWNYAEIPVDRHDIAEALRCMLDVSRRAMVAREARQLLARDRSGHDCDFLRESLA